MGLGDLPTVDDDDDGDSGSPDSQRRNTQSESEDESIVEIGSGSNKKSFSEEKWEGVKGVIRDETEYTPNEVKNLPSRKRYKILHEVALVHDGESKRKNLPSFSTQRCASCGVDVTSIGVEIAGESFCPQHPASKVAKELNQNGDD